MESITEDCNRTGASTAIVNIGASDGGIGAQRLYNFAGFSKVSEDCYQTADGRHIRDFVMELDIDCQ